MPRFLRRAYDGWCAFGRFLGVVNMFLLLTVLYWLVLPFFSLIRFRDHLGISKRRARNATYWTRSGAPSLDLADLHRQF